MATELVERNGYLTPLFNGRAAARCALCQASSVLIKVIQNKDECIQDL